MANRRGRLMRRGGGSSGACRRVSATGNMAAITIIADTVKISLLESLKLNSAIPAVNEM